MVARQGSRSPSRKICRRSRKSSNPDCPMTRPRRPMPPRRRRPATAAEACPCPFRWSRHAPAKVNLTLRVLRRRDDGYHELESLVAFADFGDRLSLSRGGDLTLTVRGPSAAAAGEGADNLVLKAARALAVRVPRHRPRRFPPRQETAGRGRARRRFGRCGGGAAASGAGERARARRSASLRGGPRHRRRCAGLPRSAPAGHARHRRACSRRRLRCRRCRRCWSTPAWRCRPRRSLPDGRPAAAPGAALDLAAIAKLTSRDPLLHLLATQSNDLEDAGDRASAGHRRCACGAARASRMPARPHVGLRRDVFRLICLGDGGTRGGEVLRDKYQHWWVKAGVLGRDRT